MQGAAQRRQILLNRRTPDDFVLYDRVAMHEDISEGHDLPEIGNTRGDLRIDPGELSERLAENGKLTLDRGVQQTIADVIVERPARDERGHGVRRLGSVPHILLRIRRQRAALACARCRSSCTGSDGAGHYEVDGSPEERLQLVLEAEICSEGTAGHVSLELDEEVDVTAAGSKPPEAAEPNTSSRRP